MKKFAHLISIVAFFCVGTASIFHIMLVRKQLEEISLSKEKRMKLNGFFRGRIASRYSFYLEDRKDSYYYSWVEENKKEMRRDGYTTSEIERILKAGEVYGGAGFDILNEEERRKILKNDGWSDEVIEKGFDRTRNFYLSASDPFALD